ncbi:MAG: desulfoferrodoxin [Clostridiales bacterium]|nr:desulfoferrodoxin [Clostridiales bacterium]
MAMKFYLCKHCGNFVAMIRSSGVKMICCGDPMTEVVPNTVEAAHEKHIPVVSVSGNTVTVKICSVEHPMVNEHYIEWIYLETKNGGQRKVLHPGDKPEATFILEQDEPVTAYAYCNLHGLWAADIS